MGSRGQIPNKVVSPTRQAQFLQVVRPRHLEIARRLTVGQRPIDIHRALGITQQRLSTIVASPSFKAVLAKMLEKRDAAIVDIQNQIGELAPDAVDELTRIMYQSNSEERRMKVARDLLDRAGYGAINKQAVDIRGNINTTEMTKEELAKAVVERFDRMRAEEEEKVENAELGEVIELKLEEEEEESEDIVYGND